ncbi:MAG: isoprenylcysteine carboxylmethyltransferase family protein [Anaerolineae bacterium]|nr:isoprenylcysteine carboxylmethyltransferase family protein [Anaerolineae bacterium]
MPEIEKATIKDDNYQPKPPKLFAWLASVVTVSLIVVTQFLPRGGDPYLRGTGAFVLLLAGGFIFWPFYLLTKYGEIKDGQTYMQARIVVDRGLYAITRHPQYLGYVLLGCGFALLSQHSAAGLLVVIGTTFFYLQAVREERYCLAQLGESYEQYCWRVPRFNVALGIVRLLRGGRK